MLEIRKNTFSKSYENAFFREFSQHLFNSFKEKRFTGVLIGSPLCEVDERLQIDALLITRNVVCIIDFKNYSGKVKLPPEKDFELGLWTTQGGEQIKGGSSINPFVQLKNQKRRFCDVANRHIIKNLFKGDQFDPFHVVRIVCFQGHVELIGSIPSREELNFFILDRTNFIEGIHDIVDVTDKDVHLSPNSFDTFKLIFRADIFKFEDRPLEDKLKDVASKSPHLDYKKLYSDQRAALTEIKAFIEDPEQQIFVLQGTINSGKSYLIPFIQALAYSASIEETEVFASSSRVVRNLLTFDSLENARSIYSYIYGGHVAEKEDEDTIRDDTPADLEGQDVSEEIALVSIPLKNSDNPENALFIVDESQLISDSYHQSIDLIFGTGYLLRDFLSFANLTATKRKVIFIGDPYQIHLGNTDESSLNPAYLQEIYKYKVSSFQLLDKDDFSDITRQSLNCVRSIRDNSFSSLSFVESEQLSFLNKDDILPYVSNAIKSKGDCHILAFTNEECQKVNHWIKTLIIKTGESLAADDLLIFNNNISIEDVSDPFAEPKKIFNGQFARAVSISNDIISESVRIKNHPEVLRFRELTMLLNDTGQLVKVLSLENYRENLKAELSRNEIIAFRGLLNIQLSKFITQFPFEKSSEYSDVVSSEVFQAISREINELSLRLKSGEKVKGLLEEKQTEIKGMLRAAKQKHRRRIESNLRKDPTSKYYKYKNAAFLRYGWAVTVHKSMSYKWKEVIFNIDQGENFGKLNESHFRWLYTGLSRATTKISLINYKPITPFDSTILADTNSGIRPKELFFVSESPTMEGRLHDLRQFILSKINHLNLKVTVQSNLQYQLLCILRDDSGKEATISIYFKDNGRFNFPTVMKSIPADFGTKLINTLKGKSSILDLQFISDPWRRHEYENLLAKFKSSGIGMEYILQAPNRDYLSIFRTESELSLIIDYSGVEKTINKITARYFNDVELWEDFKKSIETIRS